MKGLLSIPIAIAIIVASSALVVSAIFTFMNDNRDPFEFNKAKNSMASLQDVIGEYIYESSGSRVFNTNLEKGTFTVSGDSNEMKIAIDSDYIDQNTVVEEDGIIIRKGPFVSSYEKDVNGDLTPDLVLENENLLFAVRKIGNITSADAIDFSSIVVAMKNKRAGYSVDPAVKIKIDNIDSSSGFGHTELVNYGSYLEKVYIKIFVDSPKKYVGEFSLGAGNDFISFKIISVE